MNRKTNDVWLLKSKLANKAKMDFIRAERVKRNKDRFARSYNRIFTGMLRYDKFIEEVINADFKD